jgi:error-prone DNA polymerase
MSRKRSPEAIAAFHELFLSRAADRGVPAETAQRTWAQIEGFSGFGFPEAHSRSFGLLAFQSAWLCEHYAPEALASLLNEQPMGFYPPDSLVHEAERRGIKMVGVDVNLSDVLCRVERRRGGLAVRLGLGYVKGAKEEEMQALVAERQRGGTYRALAELASRSGAGRDALERLAWAGALDRLALGGSRREQVWDVGVVGTANGSKDERQLALSLEPPVAPALELLSPWGEIVENYRATGVNLGTHPLELLRPSLGGGVLRSTALRRVADNSTVEVAGMVVARQRPETAKGITFMLLEDEQGVVNLIVPSSIYERSRSVVRSAPLVRARGRLERREGVINVLVAEVGALEWSEPDVTREQSAGQSPRVGDELAGRRNARRRAVAELRAVAPSGHSFGRRGR